MKRLHLMMTIALFGAVTLSGCAVIDQMLSGKTSGGAPDGAAGKIEAARAKARAMTKTVSADDWFDQWEAWYNAFDLADGFTKTACNKDKGSAECLDLKARLDTVVKDQGDFFARTAATKPVPPKAAFKAKYWIAAPGFFMATRDAYPRLEWAKAASKTVLSYTKHLVAEAGSMEDATANSGDGRCTIHWTSGKRHDLKDQIYLIGKEDNRVYVRCTAPRDIASYPRDKKDYLAVLYYDGRMNNWEATGWSVNVSAIPEGRYVEFEVPLIAVQKAMKQKSNWVEGNLNALKFAYYAANIIRYQEDVVGDSIVKTPVWHLEEVASGTGLMDTP